MAANSSKTKTRLTTTETWRDVARDGWSVSLRFIVIAVLSRLPWVVLIQAAAGIVNNVVR